jgi:hypothetical protein
MLFKETHRFVVLKRILRCGSVIFYTHRFREAYHRITIETLQTNDALSFAMASLRKGLVLAPSKRFEQLEEQGRFNGYKMSDANYTAVSPSWSLDIEGLRFD